MVRTFTCYARADRDLARDLHRRVALRLRTHREVARTASWWDDDLLSGDRWDTVIRERIATADVAFVLLSHDLLDSEYATEVEVPAIRSAGAVLMPVELVHLDETTVDMKGLEAIQIFRSRRGSAGRSYDQMPSARHRDAFADDLVSDVVHAVRRR